MPVRPRARHCQRGFAVRRFPSGLLLRGLSGVRAVSRSRGHTRRRRRNGHFSDADGPNEAYRGHGSRALRAAIRQGVSMVRQLLPDSDREHRRSALSACRSDSFFHEPSARHRSQDEVLGPPLCRIFESSAVGPLPPDAPPPPSLGVFALRSSKLLGWWLRGLGRPNPFFDARTGAPLSTPLVLSAGERADLRQ